MLPVREMVKILTYWDTISSFASECIYLGPIMHVDAGMSI